MSQVNDPQVDDTAAFEAMGESDSQRKAEDAGGESAGMRDLVAQMIREILPSLTRSIATAEPGEKQGHGRLVAGIQEELDLAKKELEQLRKEKALQDREIFLKEELRTLGVKNIDLAFRAVRDDICQGDAKDWISVVEGQAIPAIQFLKQFIHRNPELMPARMISGGGAPSRVEEFRDECDLDQIRPGMDPAAMRRAREAVVKIIAQSKRTF